MAAARTVVLGLALFAPMAFAQAAPQSGLSETQADKLTINTLLLQRNQRDHDDLLRERQSLIQQIEAAHVGFKWDESTGSLKAVPNQPSPNPSPVTHDANPPTRK